MVQLSYLISLTFFMQRIKDEPRAFVVPIIDVIDDKTMEYYHGNGAYFQARGHSIIWETGFFFFNLLYYTYYRSAASPGTATSTGSTCRRTRTPGGRATPRRR